MNSVTTNLILETADLLEWAVWRVKKKKKILIFSSFQSLICYSSTAGTSIIYQDFWGILVFSLQKYTGTTFPSQRAVLDVEEHVEDWFTFPLTHHRSEWPTRRRVCGRRSASLGELHVGHRTRKKSFFLSLQKSWPSYSKYSSDLVMSSFTCEIHCYSIPSVHLSIHTCGEKYFLSQ